MIPLDKGKPNKNEISNFRPVSVLNTFSKIYEWVIKGQIVCGMEKYFSLFLSAYRKNYSLQNILSSLTERWRKNLDNNVVVGAVLTDLSKAFDFIPHDLLIAKLSAYNFSDKGMYCLFITDKSQAVRPYMQQTQSARDYNFECTTGIHFGADSFQPINT